ncbi:uncharacterized protein BO80DRAFT_255780 [Aspergillus ibericus CBS 121593]|uniref:Uncharacterized protein n=1 Tax=Aspergillus ibericus CBS 121593 TaxID=1448316 RepID=A0A395HCY9_9EURO|nr:hypothetical protein BO80DRAFT_255780 [Aspergillus ibericus CBS 121593]RAL04094.1 hypothetical protein BO80DRAFT_255780 [Aspergillus ibericus CBS 121593]
MQREYKPTRRAEYRDTGIAAVLPRHDIDLDVSPTCGGHRQRRGVLHQDAGHSRRNTSIAVAEFSTFYAVGYGLSEARIPFFFLLGPARVEKCQKPIFRCFCRLGIHNMELRTGEARYRQLKRKVE